RLDDCIGTDGFSIVQPVLIEIRNENFSTKLFGLKETGDAGRPCTYYKYSISFSHFSPESRLRTDSHRFHQRGSFSSDIFRYFVPVLLFRLQIFSHSSIPVYSEHFKGITDVRL